MANKKSKMSKSNGEALNNGEANDSGDNSNLMFDEDDDDDEDNEEEEDDDDDDDEGQEEEGEDEYRQRQRREHEKKSKSNEQNKKVNDLNGSLIKKEETLTIKKEEFELGRKRPLSPNNDEESDEHNAVSSVFMTPSSISIAESDLSSKMNDSANSSNQKPKDINLTYLTPSPTAPIITNNSINSYTPPLNAAEIPNSNWTFYANNFNSNPGQSSNSNFLYNLNMLQPLSASSPSYNTKHNYSTTQFQYNEPLYPQQSYYSNQMYQPAPPPTPQTQPQQLNIQSHNNYSTANFIPYNSSYAPWNPTASTPSTNFDSNMISFNPYHPHHQATAAIALSNKSKSISNWFNL